MADGGVRAVSGACRSRRREGIFGGRLVDEDHDRDRDGTTGRTPTVDDGTNEEKRGRQNDEAHDQEAETDARGRQADKADTHHAQRHQETRRQRERQRIEITHLKTRSSGSRIAVASVTTATMSEMSKVNARTATVAVSRPR